MRQLEGRVAAVTGAASGIGRSLAVALVREGMQIAISDVNEPALAETAKLARAARSGARVTSARLDAAERAAVHGAPCTARRPARAIDLLQRLTGSGYQVLTVAAARRGLAAP
jgi:NAD(P)-dependent dehydrogenase (short-subunit alcohol dehydrogenase family)